jgi:hypothetical protein
MEESQQNAEDQIKQEPQMEERTSNPEVGFPLSQQKTKKKSNALGFIVLGIVILVGGIIFFVTKGKNESEMVSPTPTGGITINTPSATQTPEAVDKEEVTIEVLNGTGTTGDASYLQGKLKSLGYTEIETGNADEQDQTITTVTFSDTLDEENKKEIQEELESLYEDVTVKTSSSLDFDVSIVTGLKKGQTAKPSATATAKATTTASPAATSEEE